MTAFLESDSRFVGSHSFSTLKTGLLHSQFPPSASLFLLLISAISGAFFEDLRHRLSQCLVCFGVSNGSCCSRDSRRDGCRRFCDLRREASISGSSDEGEQRGLTFRMSSLSSTAFMASATPSEILRPAFFISSAAAFNRGLFSSEDRSYNASPISLHELSKLSVIHTRAFSYASLAFFIASESASLSTSPCSCFTLSCNSLFFCSSSFSV